ncbi:hypothetical protein [Aliagarivorans taiwanensis]|uniref:hypothetical protein n=1 Tax=Aliagarivorans taiwanensis TaxID=561966 RepID=UPI0003F4C1B0|nr:hypothetical protein [Aliagarivorans taiwanensis]
MLKNLFRAGVLAMVALVAAGCASSGDSAGKLPRDVYLRGVFTWWDAEPQFKLQPVEGQENVWSATSPLDEPLIADGQPYEWKFGDAAWQCGTNIGFLAGEGDIALGERREANQCSAFDNFKFTPEEDGVYRFFLDWTGEIPVVYIEKEEM